MNQIKNLRSAKYLVRRYEKFLKMEIPEDVRFDDALKIETGFASDCILCKELIRKSDFNCDLCIWKLDDELISNHSHYCVNINYLRLHIHSHEEGKKLLAERIAMLKQLIKKAESKR